MVKHRVEGILDVADRGAAAIPGGLATIWNASLQPTLTAGIPTELAANVVGLISQVVL